MKFEPLRDNVAIKLIAQEEVTESYVSSSPDFIPNQNNNNYRNNRRNKNKKK